MFERRALIVLGTCLAGCLTAGAHVPTLSDGTAVDAENAIELVDVQISRVVYHEVTAAAPQLWLTFTIDAPQSLKVNLGVPYIERLADFRPALALLGPELPAAPAGLPFEVPTGLGAQLFTTDDVATPEFFNEPFSGTQSWIVFDDTLDLPAAGRYYLVAFVPSAELGKLWVAPGVKEVFTPADIAGLAQLLPAVRTFHEADPNAVPCFLIPAGFALAALPLYLMRRRRGRNAAVNSPVGAYQSVAEVP